MDHTPHTPDPTPTPLDQAVLRLGVLTGLLDRVRAAEAQARADVNARLKSGDACTARSPISDTVLIKATQSDPHPTAVITDRHAVDAWITTHYSDTKTTSVETITGSQLCVMAVLREHAPHLIASTVTVPDWAVSELERIATAAGEPVGYGGETGAAAPEGITVTVPASRLTIRRGTRAGAALTEMWRAGLIDLEGYLPALEQVL